MDCKPLDSALEDYLIYTTLDHYTTIPQTIPEVKQLQQTIEPIEKPIQQTIQEPAIKIMPINTNFSYKDTFDIPARSPARLMKKSNIPSSPEVSDSSSIEYQNYGSDRSSSISVFSDNDVSSNEDHDIIDLESDDYDKILELLDYIDVDEEEIVQKVDDVITIVGIHSSISPDVTIVGVPVHSAPSTSDK